MIVVVHGSFSNWQDYAGHFNGPKYFLDSDVIMITFGYRLGPFGQYKYAK